MSEKKSRAPETQYSPCRICGGLLFMSEYPVKKLDKKQKAGLLHTVIKCKTCGAWYGGFTKKEKKADRRLR